MMFSAALRLLGRKTFWVVFLVGLLGMPVAAQEPLRGEMRMENGARYGRLVLTFPVAVAAQATLAGGVAILRFDRAVTLAVDKIPAQMSAYVSAARLDPDRKALRLALTQSLKVDLKDGAEQLFLDLLPDGWRGAPPPLPADVAAKLAQRARAAQAASMAATPATKVLAAPVGVAVARSDGRMRLTFALPAGAVGRTEVANGVVAVAFEGGVRLDGAAMRAALSGMVEGLAFDKAAPRLSFRLAEGTRAVGSMDDGAFALDLVSGESAGAVPPKAAGSGPAAVATAVVAPAAAVPASATPASTIPAAVASTRATFAEARDPVFDADRWAKDRRGAVRDTWRSLLAEAAESTKRERSAARMRLAAFHLANGLAPEAEAVLAAIAVDDPRGAATRPALLMRALAVLKAERGNEAAGLLNEPVLASDPEAGLLRAWMAVQTGQPQVALAAFQASRAALETAPDSLQAAVLPGALDAALGAGEVAFAEWLLATLERLDATDRDPTLLPLYRGRIAEAQGQHEAALALYDKARAGTRPVEAEARLWRALLAQKTGAMPADAARAELETVGMIWRRGAVETRARARLAEMAVAEGRWRDAFAASRRAVEIQPEHPVTRALQDDMGRRFEALFLETQPGGLSRIEALAIFEEFRALIPPGARGDEIVRRLAERLVDLDLIAQAGELLTYQIESRLKGLPRAETAARLALLHLDDGKPQEALQVLRASRIAALPPELKRARVEMEARALSELGRTELALEVLGAEDTPDVERARADIYWRARRWSEAAESYERALDAVRDPDASARIHLLRAAIGYTLAGDRIGAQRLRSVFGKRMAATPDGAIFEAITAGNLLQAEALGAASRAAATAGAMGAFLDAYRKRFGEGAPAAPAKAGG